MNVLKEQDFNFLIKKDLVEEKSLKKKEARNVMILLSGIIIFLSVFIGLLLIIDDIYVEQGKQSYSLYQNNKFHFIKNYKNDTVVEEFSLLLQNHRLMSLSGTEEEASLNDLFVILTSINENKKISIDNKKQTINAFLTYLNNYNLDKEKICKNHVITCSIFDSSSYEKEQFQNKINEMKKKASKLIV